MSHYAALLLLADGRLPAGGYAHSGGFEPTVRLQGLSDAEGLERFLEGRASTTGFVASCFAAAACEAARSDADLLREFGPELDARTPSPALRAVSRSLGRQLLRAVNSIHPHPFFAGLETAPHQAVVFGVAAAAFELTPQDAAMAVLYEAVAGPAAAAAKVLSIDPFAVHAALARLIGLLNELAEAAAGHAKTSPAQLPAMGAPLLDIAAEHHRSWDVRLFAS